MLTENGILEIFGFLILLVVGKFIYAWYAEVAKRNRLMEAQVQLLLLLSQKIINRDAIKKIVTDSKIELSDEMVNALNERV